MTRISLVVENDEHGLPESNDIYFKIKLEAESLCCCEVVRSRPLSNDTVTTTQGNKSQGNSLWIQSLRNQKDHRYYQICHGYKHLGMEPGCLVNGMYSFLF